MAKKKIELVSVRYRMVHNDTFYTVSYEYGNGISRPGWHVDNRFVTPFDHSLGTKMWEMAVNVLRVWLKLEAGEDIEVFIPGTI